MDNTEYLKKRAARYERVVLLRESGMKWKDIAKDLGVSVARVQVMYIYSDNYMPNSMREFVRDYYENKCVFCSTRHISGAPLHVHHKKGKEHELKNLLLVCHICHSFLHKLKHHDNEAYDFFIDKGSK